MFCPAIFPGKATSSWTPHRVILQLDPLTSLRNFHLCPHQIGAYHHHVKCQYVLVYWPQLEDALPGKHECHLLHLYLIIRQSNPKFSCELINYLYKTKVSSPFQKCGSWCFKFFLVGSLPPSTVIFGL